MDLCNQNTIKHRIPAIVTIVNKRDLWEATFARDSVLERYMSKDTNYGSAVNQLKEKWGLPATPSNHIVFPMYTSLEVSTPSKRRKVWHLPQKQPKPMPWC